MTSIFRRAFMTTLGLAAALCASAPAMAQATATPADLQRLAAWLAGEWNNNEQVWQQKIDAADAKVLKKEDPVAHLHQVVAPVALPKLGSSVFYVQTTPGTDLSRPQRQQLFALSIDSAQGAIRQDRFELTEPARFVDAHKKPEALALLAASDPKLQAGCAVFWRYNAADKLFEGRVQAGRCAAAASVTRVPGALSDDTYKLSEEQLWALEQVRDQAGTLLAGNQTDTAARSRKVRYFEGWVWIKHAGPQATADDKAASFMRKVTLHSEGQRIPVLYNDGTASPYLLELALLTYQNTKKPILKFALLDAATGKSVTYIWANTEAALIGMNLGWFQSGMTQKAERVNFGF
jgi:hypothetical protein